jgi:O-antigen ligase
LIILALLVSFLTSRNREISLYELYTNHYAVGIVFFLITLSLTRMQQTRLISCILATGVVVSLIALHQYLFGFRRFLDYLMVQGIADQASLGYIIQKRVFFPFATPNTLAGYLAMIIPLALTDRKRYWLILPLAVAFILTKSVTALISLSLALAIYLVLRGGLRNKKVVFSILGLLLITGATFAVRMQTSKKHLQPAFSTLVRWHYWQNTVKVIKEYPWTGVGLGNFDLEKWSHYAHNSYLQIWAEMGVGGITAFLAFLAVVTAAGLKNLRRDADKVGISALITANAAFLIHNAVDFTFFLPEVSLVWWVIIGLQVSYFSADMAVNGK